MSFPGPDRSLLGNGDLLSFAIVLLLLLLLSLLLASPELRALSLFSATLGWAFFSFLSGLFSSTLTSAMGCFSSASSSLFTFGGFASSTTTSPLVGGLALGVV